MMGMPVLDFAAGIVAVVAVLLAWAVAFAPTRNP